MKSENLRKIVVAALLLAVACAALPGLSLAGWGWGHQDHAAMTEEDSEKLRAAEEKYAPGLKALEKKLDAQAVEMRRARADGGTTLAEMDALGSRMHRLEEEYRALSTKADLEAGRTAGAGHFSGGHRGYGPGNQSPGYGCGCNGPGTRPGPAAGRRGWGCRW